MMTVFIPGRYAIIKVLRKRIKEYRNLKLLEDDLQEQYKSINVKDQSKRNYTVFDIEEFLMVKVDFGGDFGLNL